MEPKFFFIIIGVVFVITLSFILAAAPTDNLKRNPPPFSNSDISEEWESAYRSYCDWTAQECELYSYSKVKFTYDNFIKVYQALPNRFRILYNSSTNYIMTIRNNPALEGPNFYVAFETVLDYKRFNEYIINVKEQKKKEKEAKQQAEVLTYLLNEIKKEQQKALNTVDSCKNELKEMNYTSSL